MNNRVMRSFSNSPAMRDAIIQTVKPILPQNEQGIILPDVHYSFQFKLDRLERVLRKITRGLFYFNNGHTPLPPDYEVQLIPRLPHDLFYKLLEKFKLASHVGPFKLGDNEVFTYMAARQPHDYNQQFYMMAFYKSFVSVGYTMPKKTAAEVPPSPIIRASA